jgi:hypothetical protein
MRRLPYLLPLVLACLLPAAAPADDPAPPAFRPDPRTVQWWPNRTASSTDSNGLTGRYGPAYRYPQAGWIVLHIEGEPYERGVQHGRLLAPEIAANLRCYAATQNPKSPSEGWRHTRTLANALFLRRYHREYLEEMKGIADGASAAGARFDGRPIDLVDLVALNAWPEIDTLDSALEATATGLEAIRFPQERPKAMPAPKPMRCSAFAATGPATADGKAVLGHITMFGLYPSNFYNVWLDIKPAKGHRVLMQSYPGGIQSGLDYYFNDAGLVVSETTLAQTKFDGTGLALASRIRQALQYADSIDKAVAILLEGNNGLYTNEWLLADAKTNEIAMFELGTHKSKLYRSSKNEWPGGTEGFYWGCNNTKDLEVRLETVASTEGRPRDAVFRPTDRDRKWLELYDRHKGKIDASFGKLAFTTPPLAASHSVDAKFTTTDMVKELKTWALFGPPLGRTWQPTFEERQRFPEVQPLVGNPWAVLTAEPPPADKPAGPAVVDLPNPETGKTEGNARGPGGDDHMPTVPAWYGTLLPGSDADIWLATAFADYERVVAREHALRKRSGGRLTRDDRDRLALDLFAYRAEYMLGSRAGAEVPLAKTASDVRQDAWFRVAAGKGVLLLHELRGLMGADAFDKMMDEFGRAHAGKEVSTAEFRNFAAKHTDKGLGAFFNAWLTRTGLPAPSGDPDHSPLTRGGPFSVHTFFAEEEQSLIVYGTQDEVNTNREAAEALQQAIRARHSNFTVPVKADRDVTDEDARAHHLLLIGRPDTNSVVARFREALPVGFGSRSFAAGEDAYAHADSAVIAAAENPANRRYSLVVMAGNGPAATLRVAPKLAEGGSAEVVIYPHGGGPRRLVLPARTPVREAGKPADGKAGG